MSLDFPFLTSSRLGRDLGERLLGHRQIAARLHGECAPDTAEEDGVNIARSLPQQPGQRVRHVSFVESIQLPVDTADPQLRSDGVRASQLVSADGDQGFQYIQRLFESQLVFQVVGVRKQRGHYLSRIAAPDRLRGTADESVMMAGLGAGCGELAAHPFRGRMLIAKRVGMSRLAAGTQKIHQPEREKRSVAEPRVERGRRGYPREPLEERRVRQTVPFRTCLGHHWPLSLPPGRASPGASPSCRPARPPFPRPSYRFPNLPETPGTPWRLCAASPRLGRDVRRRCEPLQVRHEPLDRLGRQHATERRHAARPAIIDGVEDRAVGAAIAPAPVRQARPLPPDRSQRVTAVAVERTEQLLPVRRRPFVALERVLEAPGRGGIAGGEDVLLVALGGRYRLLRRRHEQREQRRGCYSANSHTIPPRPVCLAMSGMKLAGGRTSAGSSERTSPASSAQSPPMPAYTATYCLPSGPVNVIGLPTTPDPTLNLHSARPLLASTALNQPSSVP